jgi:hypothetical protein
MTKKLHYGIHEIRLSEDEDLPALRVRITESADGWIEIRDNLDKMHHLLIAPGVPILISDDSTRGPESGPRVWVS